ncbi:MAG: hypothetical protein ACKUBY_01450 [Candidatus Moraniibacteriota bacterium]|jgi:hypothetical protein
MRAIEIIKNLINVIGSSVGVIMIAIGSVMFLGAFLKLYVFDIRSDEDFRAYQCDQIIDAPYTNPQQTGNYVITQKQLSEEDRLEQYEQCIARENKREQIQFVNRKKHAMIDGFALIVVGLPILLFYMFRAKK